MDSSTHRSDSAYENCDSMAYEETYYIIYQTLDNLSQSSTDSEESIASAVYGENFMDVVKSRELQPYTCSGEPEVGDSKHLFSIQFLPWS